ncbi:MAG: cupredoxin domain-containing protein [Candidatus Marsarchaeota archaeon]|nr:cupredoxin domain-containing protein [Candidatus Marsarchaeota archaeon]
MRLLIVLSLLAVVTLPACGADAAARPTETPAVGTMPASGAVTKASPTATTIGRVVYKVWIADSAFVPPIITIRAGEVVQWTNQDSVSHTSTGANWDSGELAPGRSYSHQFNTAGIFPYECTLHPYMKGTVIVK